FVGKEVFMSGQEIESVRRHLEETEESGPDAPDVLRLIQSEREYLNHVRPAPDRFTPQVHLFPTPGPTAGSCSLLLVPPTRTIAIVGDAILTRDHLEAGVVFEQSHDAEAAKDSLTELLEIADVFVPGHDNTVVPMR
ncbi:MAG: hypothetical protein JSU68_04450, partial [Phycisphaerales bacterium]